VNDAGAVAAGDMGKRDVALPFAAAHPDIKMVERRGFQTEKNIAGPD
jgi:hypothetical protein